MDREYYKCIVCGKEKKALISVVTKVDEHELFIRNRGVCQNCFNEEDIEEFCADFTARKLKEQIEDKKRALSTLQEELNKLEKIK